MFIFLLLGTALISDDVFDMTDKKDKVAAASEEYYTYDLHHKSPEQKYVYGYYVYEIGRRDEVVALIENTLSQVNIKFVGSTCDKFDIAYFFVKKDVISSFDYPTSIVYTKDDYYLFVCSDCEEPEIDQLISLYSAVIERSCRAPIEK